MPDNFKDALQIIELLGLPKAQQSEMPALCLLALLNMTPNKVWKKAENPLMGVTPVIEWIGTHYNKKYAPNTRETIRKNAMHKFVDAGVAIANPDKPERSTNSPRWAYQIDPSTLELLRKFRSRDWASALDAYLADQGTLTARYAKAREMSRIPLRITGKVNISLSAGAHSDLIRKIIEDFGSLFVPDGELVYVGDTGTKWGYFNAELLKSLRITVAEHGIMPDVVIYCPKRNWLILAEAVASGGPVDGKRHEDLKKLFKDSSAGLVFITAFLDEKLFRKYLNDIAWETEVWRADAPTHLIHFNGERFLGPFED